MHTEVVATTSPSAVRGKRCPKCGVKKSGELSCCARGGAWFNNCGDEEDTNVDHTWTDGIQACKGFVSLFLGNNQQSQVILRHEPTHAQLNDTRTQNGPQQKTIDSIILKSDMSTVGISNFEGFCSLSKVTVFISILSITLHMSV